MPFPFLASVAPIVASLAIWAFTQSSFAVVFALLGPVVAIASLGDSRRRSRSGKRREKMRFERDIVDTIHAVDKAHDEERALLERSAPGSAALVSSGSHDVEWWRSRIDAELPVRLGRGVVSSTVTLGSADVGTALTFDDTPGDDESDRAIECIQRRAETLEDAPIIVDGRWGIGICGPQAEVVAAASAIAVQLASALSPDEVELRCHSGTAGILDWTRGLPHAAETAQAEGEARSRSVGPGASRPGHVRPEWAHLEFRSRRDSASAHLAIAPVATSLPRDCRIVVHLNGGKGWIIRHPEDDRRTGFVADLLSAQQAYSHANALRSAARRFFSAPSQPLADRVALSELEQNDREQGERTPTFRSDANSLAVQVGLDSRGPVSLDLVNDGPHAIVGGTTGSGKSELLVSWILALATAFDPSRVNFLLVDFKGGAAFAPVGVLPHVVGVITDLDQIAAERAIRSLRAELRRRESILRDWHAQAIGDLPPGHRLPLLVIAVDEFAALASNLRELHDVFADLAARGRSLGIHLILCTQRPNGAISETILANCGLRIALRVNNAADSTAIIGSPDSASLPRYPAGRGFVTRGDGARELVQWAIADARDASRIAAQYMDREWSLHRPWLDPLPAILAPSEVPAVAPPGLSFGLMDIPEEQSREVAIFDPGKDGNLVVYGSRHSGTSTALAALADGAHSVRIVPADVEGAWDAVTETVDSIRRGIGPHLVLVDDLDTVISRFGPDHEAAFVDLLAIIAREGPRIGTALLVSAASGRGRVQFVASLCESTLLLRMPGREEHVLAGGIATQYSADLPPGGGQWKGHRVQVTARDVLVAPVAVAAPELACERGTVCVVVSSRPASLGTRLERYGRLVMLDSVTSRSGAGEINAHVGAQPEIILGDVDSWQASWALLASLRSRAMLVFHDCSASEFRSITRLRELPLPISSPNDTVLVVHPDGRMHRAKLPA